MGRKKSTQTQHDNDVMEPESEASDVGLDDAADNGNGQVSLDESETADQAVEELTPEEQIAVLTDEISHLNEQAAEQLDRFQRLSAEYVNYQKRKDQEIDKARKYAIDQFARAMLDVMESLDKACEIEEVDDSAAAVSAMREGMDLTRKQLLAAFENFGMEEINPEPGSVFDANFHQAITMLPSDEIPANHISEVFRKGYRIHDRLLRPAMVIVASGSAGETE